MQPSTVLGWMPNLATVLFVAIFCAVLLYIVTDRRRGHLRRMEAAPLDDGRIIEENDRG